MKGLTEEEVKIAEGEGRTVYNKVCRNPKCGKDFKSTSRNQRYCSDECCAYCQGINKKKMQVRKKRRREYDKNKEVNRMLSKSYDLAHKVAEEFGIPKVCGCVLRGDDLEKDPCSGQLQLHHEDGDPFNNSPRNLGWYCNHHHAQEDEKHGRINMITLWAECFAIEEEQERLEHYVRVVEG